MVELTFEKVPEDAKYSQNIYGKRDHLWQKRPAYMAKETPHIGECTGRCETFAASCRMCSPNTKCILLLQNEFSLLL